MFLPLLIPFLFLLQSHAITIKWSSPWNFLGPFTIGKTEIDGNPFVAPPYFDPNNTSKHLKHSYFSEMVTSGLLNNWTPLRSHNRNGYVQIDLSKHNTNVNRLIQLSSSINIQEFQGLVTRTFEIQTSGTYAMSCVGLHTIEIDTSLYHGDIYSSKHIYAVMHLESGSHHITSRIRGKATASFQCFITGPSTKNSGNTKGDDNIKLFAPKNVEMPDIVNGKLLTAFLSLKILNVGNATISKMTFVTSQNDNIRIQLINTTQTYQVFPGQTLALPVEIHLINNNNNQMQLPKGEKEKCLRFTVTMTAESKPYTISATKLDTTLATELDTTIQKQTSTIDIVLRCRSAAQSHLMTYLSHDGTVASAALLRPHTFEKCSLLSSGCPVVLALSGVGVAPTNMADSFKYKTKKSKNYIFGLRRYWIIAPERDGAHNYEGTGHLTAMSSLQALQELYPQHVDITKLMYTGHSRGGHGSLVFGTHHPDLSCGVFASNGWIRREYYADANPIFDHDLQLSKYSKRRERASRNGSTVVDIFIPPPYFKPVLLSFSRFPLF